VIVVAYAHMAPTLLTRDLQWFQRHQARETHWWEHLQIAVMKNFLLGHPFTRACPPLYHLQTQFAILGIMAKHMLI